MGLIFLEGPNFSGRSAALRGFAWRDAGVPAGQYLHPDLELNLSGLATSVAGERGLHHPRGGARDVPLAPWVDGGRAVSTLSGGERAALELDCALALSPSRLAIDCTLEQIDANRRPVVVRQLRAASNSTEIRVADNDASALACDSDGRVQCEVSVELAGFNEALGALAEAHPPPAIRAPAIRLEGVTFRYPGSVSAIFDQADLSLDPGHVYVLKAPNGAGKSTLARLLVGVLPAFAGTVRLGDVEARGRVTSTPFFYAFQNPRDQVFGRTASDYVRRVASLGEQRRGWPTPSWLAPEVALAATGLAPFAQIETSDLPFVALKRLSLCAALVSRAPWFFLDEPALGLDGVGRIALSHTISVLARAGYGVIIITHGKDFDNSPFSRPITIEECRFRLKGG